jgi:eukaryotic-like serine/threonine-protein kinase
MASKNAMANKKWCNEPTLLDPICRVATAGDTKEISKSLFDAYNPADAAESQDALYPSTIIDGYELLEEVGRGAMGIVYKARDRRLGRLVAIKLMAPSRALNARNIEQFFAEAALAAELHHPGIVEFEAAGCSNGQPYICMELVEGTTVANKLAAGRLPAVEAARLLAEIAEAADSMHEQGIIHRDLKPANILLDSSGRTRIADFGLAMKFNRNPAAQPAPQRRLEKTCRANATDETSEQPAWNPAALSVCGTPLYMSPEQAAGEVERMDPASDIYALGAILYQSVTGRPPFVGTRAAEVIAQVISMQPPAPRSLSATVPAWLEAIILRCLQKDPKRRYPSAGVLAAELRRFAAAFGE